VRTPVFMPVGTVASVKGLSQELLDELGVEILLNNTYHLYLRPGVETVRHLGGVQKFMGWHKPILTDSGGFQVFSLSELRKLTEDGVQFRSHLDGSLHFFSPETSLAAEIGLGADIVMAFDECTPFPADEALARSGVRRTLAWLERCLAAHAGHESRQALFGIVQGSVYPELRRECARAITGMDLPGIAIGGVSVGEGHELLCKITEQTAPLLPENKPRYLMGVGLPEDLLAGIGFGIDMFDCVIPTRHARGGAVYTARGRIRLTNRRYRRDAYPIDTSCGCAACAGGFSRAYLHHLFAANEVLSAVLASIHNLHFYEQLVRRARAAILEGGYLEFQREFLAGYRAASAD
jgi:queuine tRNA-ribosyltransferase